MASLASKPPQDVVVILVDETDVVVGLVLGLAVAAVVVSWAKAPALYVTMSQVVVEGHFLDLAFRAQIELRNVKVKVTLR